MKLIEKLADGEADEMILATDVDDTQCSELIANVPVPQIADRIVEVDTAFHGSESHSESLHRSSTCQHTQSDRRRSSKIQAASYERTGCEDCFKKRSSSELVKKL